MTPREKELFEIIREDPLISQNEIAAKMNITRTAVSVYLNSMYKSGVLLGRGYIINDQSFPVVIGPGHVDILSITDGMISKANLHSVRTQLRYGGSAKNVVNLLFSFSSQPRAVFIVGDDDMGEAFLKACADEGISPTYSIKWESATTPIYIEIVDQNRNIIASSFSFLNPEEGAQDYTNIDISPVALRPHENMLRTASIFIVHDSMPTGIVEYLSSSFPSRPIFLIGSGANFIMKHREHLASYYSTVMSLEVAAALALQSFDVEPTKDDLNDICRELLRQGLRRFFIMVDRHMLVYCSDGQVILHVSDNPSALDGTDFGHYYSDCRDFLAAVICYDIINEPELSSGSAITTLNHMAAARNFARSRDYYFDRTVSMQAIQTAASKLQPQIVTYKLQGI